MLPTDKEILAAFPEPPKTLHLKDLLRVLDLPRDARLDLRERVRELAAEGHLERAHGRVYGRPLEAAGVVGTLTVNPRGFAFLSVEGDAEDLYVDRRNLGDAMHRDRVRAKVQRGTRGRHEAAVVEVLERGTHTFVGTYRDAGRTRLLHPQDDRLPEHVLVDGPCEAQDGDTVAATFVEYPRGRLPGSARILKVFGEDGEAAQETDLVVYDCGLPIEFSPETEEEVAALPGTISADERARRTDLTVLPLCTIDPESARDFDDAVHAEPREGGGWFLTVAVADVSHYVRPDTALDRDALARGTSVYLPDRVLPMLPHRLSSDLCSLRPNEDRLCMAVLMEVAPDGELLRARMCEGVMHSHGRFTYDRAADMLGLRGADPAADEDPTMEALRPSLEAVLHCTRALRHKRRRRGYLDLDVPEPRIVLGADGEVDTVLPKARHEAHQMIEEAMVAANEAVAHVFAAAEEPAIFRTHDRPSAELLARLRAQLELLGVDPGKNVRPNAGRLTTFLRKVADHPQAALLNVLLLRSMARAVYEEEPAPHFGLGAPEYLHFTSPIRRYPDLAVHRLVKARLNGGDMLGAEALEALAAHCGRRESLAMDAERSVLDLYKALMLRKHLGEEFEGTVVSVVGFGVFVQLDDYPAEGVLAVEDMHDDYYELEESGLALVGRRTGNAWTLGDRARVRVDAVDVRRRRVNFGLVERLPRPG